METLIPLTAILLQRLYRQYLVEALIEDAFLHLAEPERETAEFGSVEATIAFVDIASFTALAVGALLGRVWAICLVCISINGSGRGL